MPSTLLALLDEVKKALSQPVDDPLRKTFNVALGITNYSLERPALALYPWGEMLTPMRNKIPRVKANPTGDVATHWKSITGINTTQMPPGLSEGNRSGVITTTTASNLATYVGLGLEDNVTFESDYAAEGFDDVKARAVEGLLRSLMIAEERMIYGGNSSVALGTTPTPTLTTAATGGALSDNTFKVVCIALTHDGYLRSTVAAGVVQTIARTNADGSSDTINGGVAQRSAVASITIAGGGSAQVVKATVAAVLGAVGYAWYISTNDATHQYLAAITTINSYVFTAVPANTFQDAQALTAADYSTKGTYSFDGLLYQTGFKSGSGSYYLALATGTPGTGTVLTSDGAGGITEINTAFRAFWDNYRLSPDEIWLSAQEALNINSKVIAGGGTPLFRFQLDGNTQNVSVIGGVAIGSLLNKITNQLVRIRIHPNAVPGTILFTATTIPYPLSGVGNVVQIKTRREYYQTEWPLRTRKYEYGVYVDEVLQNYFPPAFGVLTNIANG